jgi:uncharacterized surface protein with fasciclin (FAS1) repeats
MQKIKQTNQGTILVPTNEAFNEVTDREIDENILSLHFIDQTILTSDARIKHPEDASGVKYCNDYVYIWQYVYL